MPMILTEQQRRQVATRLMVQPPQSSHDIAEFQSFQKEVGRLAGLPADVLIVLQVLEDLADQGNEVSKALLMDEQQRLGITYPRRF